MSLLSQDLQPCMFCGRATILDSLGEIIYVALTIFQPQIILPHLK